MKTQWRLQERRIIYFQVLVSNKTVGRFAHSRSSQRSSRFRITATRLHLFELVLLSNWGQSTACSRHPEPAGLNCFTAECGLRGWSRFCHTSAWPLSRAPDGWSRRPALPAAEGSGGSRGASRSLYLKPAWRWPWANCKRSNRTKVLLFKLFTCCHSDTTGQKTVFPHVLQ